MTYRRLMVQDARGRAPLSRRDFVTLRVSEGKRVLELSCESFFMRYHDARSDAARRQVSNHDDLAAAGGVSAGFDTLTPEALFAELDRQLAEADEVRVLGRDWLDGGAFGRELGARLEAFRQRGGQVQLGALSQPTKTGATEP